MAITFTANPTADTRMTNTAATTNYGTDTEIRLGNRLDVYSRVLMKFDLSSIPISARVQTAKLRLYFTADYASVAPTFSIYRVKRNWVETQATWNIYSTGNNWQTAGCGGADDRESSAICSKVMTATETLNEYKEFDLTASAIEEFISGAFSNNGIFIKANTESAGNYNGYGFNSREAASNKPELVIEYIMGARQLWPVLIGF